jgi:predicted DNA-binding transcriptional regulator YafY
MPKRKKRAPSRVNQTRLIQLSQLIRERQPISARELMDELEVARPTVMRDIEQLRSRLNVPIVYDRQANGYRVEEDNLSFGPTFEVPGFWLDDREVYALLTLLNVLSELDPGMLQLYVWPLKGALKRILGSRDFPMRGFHRKVAVEIDNILKPRLAVFSGLSTALMEDKRVVLTAKSGKVCATGECSPQRCVLTASGWHLDYLSHNTSKAMRIPLVDLASVLVLDKPSTFDPQFDHDNETARDRVHRIYRT